MRQIGKSDELMAILVIILLLVYAIIHTQIYVSSHMQTERLMKQQYNKWIKAGYTDLSLEEFRVLNGTPFDLTGGSMRARYKKQ